MTHPSLALITGAASGIGLACAQMLGTTMTLILTDRDAHRLDAASHSLRQSGAHILATVAGSLQEQSTIDAIEKTLPADIKLRAIVHAAGQSPTQGDWKSSVLTNIVGTERILRMIEKHIAPSTVAILLSSVAAHVERPLPPVQNRLEDCLHPQWLDRLAPFIEALPEEERSGLCYALAKRRIVQRCEVLAAPWGRRGARILSVSPGITDAPMGQSEAAHNPAAMDLLKAIPLARMGSAHDIATAIRFLVSAESSYITGCDLRIDGGLTAALKYPSANE